MAKKYLMHTDVNSSGHREAALRGWMCRLASFAFLLFFVPAALRAENANEERLLIDDQWVSSMSGLVRFLERPVKRPAPLIVSEGDWEQNPYLFGTVIYDQAERIFKMWYMSYNRGKPAYLRTTVLYATSRDGIQWEKPRLGLFDFQGNSSHNVLFASLGYHDLYSPSVIKDDDEADPSRRYKMIFWDKVGPRTYGDGGMHVAFSSDGLRWICYDAKVPRLYAKKEERSISDVMDLMHDKANGKYVVYAKGWKAGSWDNPDSGQRIIVRTESSDFINWTEPEPVIRHSSTIEDPQSYGMPVFYHKGYYLGLVRSYKVPGNDLIDIRLMSSRDGVVWEKVCGDKTYISTGDSDLAWDDGMVFTAPPIVHNGEVLIYYGGWDGPHGARYRHSAIGLAKSSASRIVGVRAQGEFGSLLTPMMAVGSGVLCVNANAVSGLIKVAVVGSDGRDLPGLGAEDCDPIVTDAEVKVVTWKSGAKITDYGNAEVAFKFYINGGAVLYSYGMGLGD